MKWVNLIKNVLLGGFFTSPVGRVLREFTFTRWSKILCGVCGNRRQNDLQFSRLIRCQCAVPELQSPETMHICINFLAGELGASAYIFPPEDQIMNNGKKKNGDRWRPVTIKLWWSRSVSRRSLVNFAKEIWKKIDTTWKKNQNHYFACRMDRICRSLYVIIFF